MLQCCILNISRRPQKDVCLLEANVTNPLGVSLFRNRLLVEAKRRSETSSVLSQITCVIPSHGSLLPHSVTGLSHGNYGMASPVLVTIPSAWNSSIHAGTGATPSVLCTQEASKHGPSKGVTA
ncbi:hypothetical protein PVAP13_4KG373900 [Panicum virgatum]|uniref:Uncharacterized protein n=1 Tax=Panicum virgatum TaxID=38727 RepID=A0A8T0TZH5_PANVG|nr:hypothetical protein PVAP13_4KG373900 [Panicum virgatum]